MEKLLKKLNITIKNKKLIENAFAHSSFVNEKEYFSEDNERLEFIGDSVLQLWTAHQLYNLKEHLNEGAMTTLRAQLVCEKALADYARELEFSNYLLLGEGERKNGGEDRDSILADTFEAFLGALYLDSGFEPVTKVLEKTLLPQIYSPKQEEVIDYKTMLQEYIQADSRKTIKYETIKSTGPSNAPTFYIVVKLDGIPLGYGHGTSKKRGEQKAAQDAFMKLAK